MISSRADRARRDALLGGLVADQRLDLGIGHRRARAGLVEIEALPVFWPKRPCLAQRVGDHGRQAARLAVAPADVEAGEVAHLERPHRPAEIGERLVDLAGRRALEQQRLGFEPTRARSMRLPTKPWQTPTTTGTLPIRRAMSTRSPAHRGAVFSAAHDLQQLHDIGRREEMQAEHILRPRVEAAISLMSR